PRVTRANASTVLEELRIGLSFVKARRALMTVVALSAAVAFVGYPVLTLLPLFATAAGPGVEGYSILMVCVGAGAIAGTLLAAWLGHFPHMARVTVCAVSVLGALVTIFASSHTPWLTYL